MTLIPLTCVVLEHRLQGLHKRGLLQETSPDRTGEGTNMKTEISTNAGQELKERINYLSQNVCMF